MNRDSEERRLVSRGTIRVGSDPRTARIDSMAPSKNAESDCGGSVDIVELYGPDTDLDTALEVPKKDGESQTVGSRPSRMYFTITDEEASPGSEVPTPPRA